MRLLRRLHGSNLLAQGVKTTQHTVQHASNRNGPSAGAPAGGSRDQASGPLTQRPQQHVDSRPKQPNKAAREALVSKRGSRGPAAAAAAERARDPAGAPQSPQPLRPPQHEDKRSKQLHQPTSDIRASSMDTPSANVGTVSGRDPAHAMFSQRPPQPLQPQKHVDKGSKHTRQDTHNPYASVRDSSGPAAGATAGSSRSPSGAPPSTRPQQPQQTKASIVPEQRQPRSSSKGIINRRDLTKMVIGCGSLEQLDSVVLKNKASFNYIHASAALSQAVMLILTLIRPGGGREAPVTNVLEVVYQKVALMKSREVSTCLHALARLDLHDEPLIAALVMQAKSIITNFNSQDMSDTLWAVVKLGHPDQAFTKALLSQWKATLHSGFKPRAMANTFWAVARLEHRHAAFTAALILQAKAKLPEFTPQCLSITLTSFAKLQHPDADFRSALVREAHLKLYRFSATYLAQTLWAVATLEHRNAGFSAAFFSRAAEKLSGFNAQDLANTIWAMAKLEHRDAAIMAALLREAKAKQASFRVEEKAMVFWAVKKLGVPSPFP